MKMPLQDAGASTCSSRGLFSPSQSGKQTAHLHTAEAHKNSAPRAQVLAAAFPVKGAQKIYILRVFSSP